MRDLALRCLLAAALSLALALPAAAQVIYGTGLSNSNVVTSAAPFAPAGTTNLTGVYMGVGVNGLVLTPRKSGNVLVEVRGEMANGTAGSGSRIFLAFGTGSAPANGSTSIPPTVGTFCPTGGAAFMNWVSVAGGAKVPFSISCLITGLTLNTAYWFDIVLNASTSGTATLTNVAWLASEQ